MNKKTNTLSTGYYTIFKVIVSLASNTKIMILDEPVLGIDSLYRELFYEVLSEYHKKNNNLILIATHLIDEVEPVLEEVKIIDDGIILVGILLLIMIVNLFLGIVFRDSETAIGSIDIASFIFAIFVGYELFNEAFAFSIINGISRKTYFVCFNI